MKKLAIRILALLLLSCVLFSCAPAVTPGDKDSDGTSTGSVTSAETESATESFTDAGAETDTEPEDEDYIGEYSVGLLVEEVLTPGRDDSVEIYKGSIEISLKCIPERISLPDGTLLWERKD